MKSVSQLPKEQFLLPRFAWILKPGSRVGGCATSGYPGLWNIL
jgi:hypothetical protein